MVQAQSRQSAGARYAEEIRAATTQFSRLLSSQSHYAARIAGTQRKASQAAAEQLSALGQSLFASARAGTLWADWQQYLNDASQRYWLTLDTLRERGNTDIAHEAAGAPPVLKYDYELVVDGRTLARPVNYQLLRIVPPTGVTVIDSKRPYMIIDPRAGHGAGIGGFKDDSQVGVALRAGHPVYFVVFRQHPEPGQTLADVTRAEAGFVREIARRHPKARRPVVVGNCQGGWATLLLAAAYPDLTGPLVINGAPVATWSGQIGDNPMRYNGGLLGGVVPALFLSDLGAGEFDGAHLVSNFEVLNPGRNLFEKYYDLFANIDTGREGFLEFEKWWGAYHFTNEEEIRWIIEQLFVGNRLSQGSAQLEPGMPVDLKTIKSPIIVFASRGDNITPPQQALNWIADTFVDEQEIRIRGQRIIYMVHEKVGHLGIFVSSSIARKEHTEVTSTLKAVEALQPGLYEMSIDETLEDAGNEHFLVSFHERTIADVLAAVENDRELETEFATVARLSEAGATAYELAVRPFVQGVVSEPVAQAIRNAHSARALRKAFSDQNPAMQWVRKFADVARRKRQPAHPDNPFTHLEQGVAGSVTRGLDLYRDLRDALYESSFLGLYGLPLMRDFGQRSMQRRSMHQAAELRNLPEVQRILNGMEHGDVAAAVIRMLILLAESRGEVRKDRLERSATLLHDTQPFAAMGAERRAALIHEQSILVEFERERALSTLPTLLRGAEARRQAMAWIHFVVGERSDMVAHSLELVEQFEQLLGVPFEASRKHKTGVDKPHRSGKSGGAGTSVRTVKSVAKKATP